MREILEKRKMRPYGGNGLLVGGSHDISRAFAEVLAESGMELVIADKPDRPIEIVPHIIVRSGETGGYASVVRYRQDEAKGRKRLVFEATTMHLAADGKVDPSSTQGFPIRPQQTLDILVYHLQIPPLPPGEWSPLALTRCIESVIGELVLIVDPLLEHMRQQQPRVGGRVVFIVDV